VPKCLLVPICLALLLTGCGPSYDKEAFEYTEAYASEIVPAVEEAAADLQKFIDNEDIELQKLQEHADNIKDINNCYWTEDFPEDTDIEDWTIPREDNGEIDGQELADALWFMGANSDWLRGVIENAVEAQGDLDEHEKEELTEAVEEARDTAEWLKMMKTIKDKK